MTPPEIPNQVIWPGEDRLNLLATALPGTIYEWDVLNDTVKRSNGLYELIGWYPHEVPAHSSWWRSLIHPDDIARLSGMVAAGRLERARSVQAQYRVLHRSGQYVWVWDTCAYTYDDAGMLIGALGCTINIDAQKQAEAGLLLRKAQWEALFNSTQDAILVADDRGVYVAANPAACRMVGLTEQELIGKRGTAIVPVSDADFDEIWANFLREGKQSAEIRLRGADGRTVIAEYEAKANFMPGFHVSFLRDVTEQRHLQREARLTQDRLQLALSTAPISLFSQDANLRYLWTYNPSHGYEVSDVLGKADHELIESAEDVAALTALKRRALETGERQRGDVRIRTRGVEGFYDLTVDPVLDEYGVPIAIVCAATDITERKRLERTARENEERLQVALRSAPITLFYQDTDLRYRWIYNPALGYEDKDIVGLTDEELTDNADDLVALVALKRRALATGQIIRADARMRANGKEGYYDLTLEPVFDAAGQVIGLIGAAVDITQKKQAENALRASEQLARQRLDEIEAIYKTVPIGLCVLDENLRWVRINERLAEINGYPIADHLGKTVQELLPDIAAAAYPVFKNILTTGESVYDIEIRGTTPAEPGRERVWMEQWTPIRDNDGAVIGINIVAEEVTERKRDEEFAAILYRLSAALAAATTVNAVADTIVQYGIYATGANGGSLALLDDDGDTLRMIRTPGFGEDVSDYWREFSLSESRTPIAIAIKERRAILINGWGEVRQHFPSPGDAPVIAQPPPSLAALPMITDDQVLGGLGLVYAGQQVYDERQRTFLETLAGQCAQALERAILNERAQELTALQERQRLARDLHDAVSQTLFSATMMAEAIPRQLQRDPERALALTQQLVTLNRGALAEMRTLLFELRPEGLLKTKLGDLLHHLVATARGRKEIAADLKITGTDCVLPGDAHVALYRVAQEAVNNILKHSSAEAFQVQLVITPDRVELTICDDGQGFDPGLKTAGFGLGSMRERAEAIGAVLRITSGPGSGTTVAVVWRNPLPTGEAAD